MTNTKKATLLNTQNRILASAVHLSAWRMALAANTLTPGTDWLGSTKQEITQGLIEEGPGVAACCRELSEWGSVTW